MSGWARVAAASLCAAALQACTPDAGDARHAEAPAPAPAPAAPAQPAPVAPSLQPAAAPAAPEVQLAGVIYLGQDNPASQALLSVRHQSQQAFRAGDRVADEWTLRTIGPDYVVIARSGQEQRIELMAQARSAARAATATASRDIPAEKPLPGFAQAPPPRVLAEGNASERNRRFLDAVRQRRAASGS